MHGGVTTKAIYVVKVKTLKLRFYFNAYRLELVQVHLLKQSAVILATKAYIREGQMENSSILSINKIMTIGVLIF